MKALPVYITVPILSGIIYAVAAAYTNNKGFKERLIDYIESNALTEETKVAPKEPAALTARPYFSNFSNEQQNDILKYRKGDWDRYVIGPEYQALSQQDPSTMLYQGDDVNIHSYGSMRLALNYGGSVYTDDKYRQYDEDTAASRVIESGFVPTQEMQLHMEGKIGKRLTVYIDHDSRKEDNRYLMQYRAVRDDEIIREINAGEIDIKFNHSKYAVYDNSSAKGMGLDVTLKKNDLQVKAFGSITRGNSEVETFTGKSSPGSHTVAEYQYIKRAYYQLEPFKRYDNISSTASLPSGAAAYTSLVTFTSAPADIAAYSLSSVNISSSQFELYMDDQNAYNNYNAITLSLDGGYYTKLVSGSDYTINYTTGLITFLKDVPQNARIFAAYSLQSGSTADPSARTDVSPFTGRYFVFIKYGYSIDEDADDDFTLDVGEDKNGDSQLNLDIYEVRSFYYTGEKYLLSNNFRMQFFKENEVMTGSTVTALGSYTIDYARGIVGFTLREPFKSFNSGVYLENQPTTVYVDSRYKMAIDYYREARSFQLKHFNIIPNSVRVKVNGRVLSASLYTIDHTSGFLFFPDPNNPLVGPATAIEVRYEYLPFGAQGQAFVGGLRADYKINRSLNLGGSVLFTRTSSSEEISNVNDSPTETALFEGDAALHLDEKRIAEFANLVGGTRRKKVPVEIKAYGEYARSYKNVNSFGKGLIDNMESTEEIVGISVSEKDWVLSSMPSSYTQTDRGQLFYKFYRSLSEPETLQGESYSSTSVDYSVKPGPYNVASGHVSNSIQETSSQRSLVLDFDFTSGNCVSIAARKLSTGAVDFSGLQYVEISYKYTGTTGEAVDIHFDLGKIKEDSDEDSVFDTEDANSNGYLDTDPSAGLYEDRGYAFNGNNTTTVGSGPGLDYTTSGDGVLNSEDLNGNGILDTTELAYTIPDSSASISVTGSSTWTKKRIYIDRSSLTSAQTDILREVEAMRLYLVKNGSTNTGTVYIDNIKFVSSRWSSIVLDKNSSLSVSTELKATIINSINDDDYRSEAFLFSEKDVYKSLYGDKTDSELSSESESALQLAYAIPSNTSVSITRRFSTPLDIRFYKTMNLWLNVRDSLSGTIGIIIGSSDNDYVEYQFPPDYANVWREKKLKLISDSQGDIEVYSSTGTVDMKRIAYITFVIYDAAGSGTIWLNDIYVSEPETLSSGAHWYEGELRITKPLFRTDGGVPILSDIHIKYIQKGHDANFSTIAMNTTDIEEEYKEVYSSVNILPNWNATVDFITEDSETDSLNEEVIESKRGTSSRNSLSVVSDYVSNINAVPSVKVSYKHDSYTNYRDETISSTRTTKKTETSTHTPVIAINEQIRDFLWGHFSLKILTNMFFKKEEIERTTVDQLDEKEKRQKSGTSFDINYRNKVFYFRPTLAVGSEEIIALSGKGTVNDMGVYSDVESSFHFPLVYGNNFKFVERNKKAGVVLGFNILDYVLPEYKFDFHYLENRFLDYNENQTHDSDFSRTKDARSFISTNIKIPIKLKKLEFVKGLNLSYGRSVYFSEAYIPYEGENSGSFEEQYGINRPLGGLSGVGMNIFKYYPGYFFFGRGNAARGRDYAYNKFNSALTFPVSGITVSDYTNNLKLVNNFSLNWTFDFKKFTVSSMAGLNQVCERNSVYGIPQQVVSRNFKFDFNFNLMKLFDFGFFRPNEKGQPHHSANLSLGYAFDTNMIITSNIEENSHSPNLGLTFKWDRTSLGFKTGVAYKIRNDEEYIFVNDSIRHSADDIYIANMAEQAAFKENDFGYTLSVLYVTDVEWLYNYFATFYKLAARPIFSVEYSMALNRYDYSNTVSPEPYDLYLVKNKLTLDLHKNIQGGLANRFALEQFRNRETSGISKEVFSYEITLNFSLIF
ncbi:MAG: hypothetical protein GY754_31940 [bacterium]|nr:hypothetical protein [bacterium]